MSSFFVDFTIFLPDISHIHCVIMANRIGDKKSQQNGHANQCFVCKKICYNTCSRCGEFYCSKQCQTDDWREHKYYCFEMPDLVIKSPASNGHQFNHSPKFQSDNRRIVQNLRRGEQLQSNPSDVSPRNESRQSERSQNTQPTQSTAFNFADYPKHGDDVVLTHVRRANSFYIRACCFENEYMRNVNDFDEYGKRASRLRSLPPRKNDIVLVRYDGKYQRAVVLNDDESEEKIEVALADTGRKIHKASHDMREISDELKSRKRYNFIVTLDHMPNKLKPEDFNKLLEFVKSQTVFKIQFDGGDWKCAKNFDLLRKDSGLTMEQSVLGNKSIHVNGNDSGSDKNAKPVEVSSELETPTVVTSSSGDDTAEVESASVTRNIEMPTNSRNVAGVVAKSHHPITFEDLATETLPGVTELIIVENNTINQRYVSAVANKDFGKLSDLLDKVNECGSKIDEIYEPDNDELCLVYVEDEWYRAVRCESKYLLIDFGSIVEVDKSNIRRFPEELNDPCYTFACYVDGLMDVDGWPAIVNDKEKVEQLKKLLTTKEKHPDCVCVKYGNELMEYKVKFPRLKNFF